MTVAEAILRPTATPIILAEITCGVHFRNWVVDGTFTNTYKVTTALEIEAVKWNLTTTLTERASATLVNSNAGSWHWDGSILWVRPPSGQSIFTNTVQAFAAFYFSHPRLKIFNDRPYHPRLRTAPNLSKRIEFVFGGVSQRGGGSIVLENSDGYFDSMQDYQWDAGSVTLKLGIDLPGNTMAIGDYVTLATWIPEDWSRTNDQFNLKVVESKARLKTKLPNEFFTREDFPQIDDDQIGKPIPIAYGRLYGIKPIVIDTGAKQFKVTGHAIRELTEVRVEKTITEQHDRTVTDWIRFSGDTFRYYLPSEEVTAVKFNSAVLANEQSLDDVLATPGTWTVEESFVYVTPSSGQTITSGTYTVESNSSLSSWRNVDFASIDLANGEFTLGDGWNIGEAVSVDFQGKTDSGVMLRNSVDIIEDILTTAGETNLDSASFTEAHNRLDLGTDEDGNRVTIRNVGIYLEDPEDVLEVVAKILEAIGGYMFSDETGQYHIGVFEPQPGEALTRFTDTDVLDIEELSEGEDRFSKVLASYRPVQAEDYSQHEETEEVERQYIHSQPSPVVKEVESLLVEESAVENHSRRTLRLQGQPLKKFTLQTKWQAFRLSPGDQIWLQYSARGIDQVLEIIEVRLDLGSKTSTLMLGNLRGLVTESGFWVAEAATLPARFSALTGYAAGVLTWGSTWADPIKPWAKQNLGHWTDANGFATTTDGESHRTSTWI